jgi:Transglutaminase-like superfamily
MNVGRSARATFRLPAEDRRLLVSAACWLAACRVALWTVPFPRTRDLVESWGTPRRGVALAPGRIAWAVRTAARPIPGATCLTQALAAAVMLRRGGAAPVVRFGVTREQGDFEAHAWLELDGRVLVGDQGLDRYATLAEPSIVEEPEPPVDSTEP